MTEEGPLKRAVKRGGLGEHWWSGPTVLYLDDIEEIYDLFERADPNVSLQLDDRELNSPADAPRLRSIETRQLEIHSNSPYITFGTDGKEFRFYISDERDFNAIGLRDATKKIVEKRRLWRAKALWRYYPLLVPGYLALLVPKGPYSIPAFLLSLIPSFAFFAVLIVDLRNRRRQGKVILRDSRSKPSFWQTYHDLLLVLLGFVLTVVGGVTVGIILYLLGFVGSPQASPLP